MMNSTRPPSNNVHDEELQQTLQRPTEQEGDIPVVPDGKIEQILKALMSSGTYVAKFVCIFINVILVLIPFGLITIGSCFYTKCPATQFIPIYLIVAGIFGLIIQCIKLHYFRTRPRKVTLKELLVPIWVYVIFCIWCFSGGLSIYLLKLPSFTITDPNYCNKDLYKFIIITIKLGVIYLLLQLGAAIIFFMPSPLPLL